MENLRYIQIDDDTRVGYSYVKEKFYVTNKGYTTYRDTIEQIQAILASMDITNIPDMEIQALTDSLETLHNVYYTWNDEGSYIKSLQFNDFSENVLVLNCEKKKIYVTNSNIVYDLEINESIKNVRVPYLCSYYKSKLGIDIPQEDMLSFYNLLISFYKPTPYIQMSPITSTTKAEDPLMYTNVFMLSNYNETAKATYYGIYNALNKLNPSPIGYINSITIETQCIETVVPIEGLNKGDKIEVQGTQTLDGTYKADGTYTVSHVEDNQIYVDETIPTSYMFPHRTCSLISTEAQIQSIDRTSQTITLTQNVPNTIFVGDTIHVSNTSIHTDYETITCNGAYTVQAISNNVITVQEMLPTNFTSTEEQKGILDKRILLGNVKREEGHTIYMLSALSTYPEIGAKVYVYDPLTSEGDTYIVSAISTINIDVEEELNEYIPEYPNLYKLVQGSETLINVTFSKVKELPMGEFLLDTYEQACAYMEIVGDEIPTPEGSFGDKFYNEVEKEFDIETTESGISKLELLGYYSLVYHDNQV